MDAAKERFARYFRRKAARDELNAEDLPHLREADRMELGFKKVRLAGSYKLPSGYRNDMGGCVRRALEEALQIEVENLPNSVDPGDMPSICAELGLVYHAGPKKVTLPADKEVIILYETSPDSAHAVVTDDLSEFSKRGKKVVGIIEVPTNIKG